MGEGTKDWTGVSNNKEINWGKWTEYNIWNNRNSDKKYRLLVAPYVIKTPITTIGQILGACNTNNSQRIKNIQRITSFINWVMK